MFLKELLPQTKNKTNMKVKVFVHHAFENVEEVMNEWIKDCSVKIHHVTQSQSEKQGKFVFVLSVFYEPCDD